jgi:hypothetical protein
MIVHTDDEFQPACTEDAERDLAGMGTWIEGTSGDDIALEDFEIPSDDMCLSDRS